MPICRTYGHDRKKYANGQCGLCYGREYQRDKRRRLAEKARKSAAVSDQVKPRGIMHMKPEQIIENWPKILRGAGL